MTPTVAATRPPSPRTGAGGQRDAVALAVAGTACISLSAPLVALAGTSAGTAAAFRCLLALPFLIVLARLAARAGAGTERRAVARPRRELALAFVAGGLLGADLVLWSQAIAEIGAGAATVLVNLQVVIFPLLAFAFDGARPHRRFVVALVPLLGGVALVAGVGGGAFGAAPLLGAVHSLLAAACYAGYLFVLRRSADTRPAPALVLEVTVAATVVCVVFGGLWSGIDLTPSWAALGWLLALALTGQVAGGLLLAKALPRLSAHVGAALLLLQPVGSLLLGVAILAERPSAWQLTGCGVVLAAIAVARSGVGGER